MAAITQKNKTVDKSILRLRASDVSAYIICKCFTTSAHDVQSNVLSRDVWVSQLTVKVAFSSIVQDNYTGRTCRSFIYDDTSEKSVK